jgi:hypothetical protein
VNEALVNDYLFGKFAVSSVIVEFNALHESWWALSILVVGVVLEGLHDWHATLVGLDDLKLHLAHEVFVVFSDNVALDVDDLLIVIFQSVTFFVVLGVLVFVILLPKLKECFSWILNFAFVMFQEAFEVLDLLATDCICWGL